MNLPLNPLRCALTQQISNPVIPPTANLDPAKCCSCTQSLDPLEAGTRGWVLGPQKWGRPQKCIELAVESIWEGHIWWQTALGHTPSFFNCHFNCASPVPPAAQYRREAAGGPKPQTPGTSPHNWGWISPGSEAKKSGRWRGSNGNGVHIWQRVTTRIIHNSRILEATFPYSENLRIPCFHRTPDLGFGMLVW